MGGSATGVQPPPPIPAESDYIAAGVAITVVGLQTTRGQALNGLTGYVLRGLPHRGRFEVSLTNGAQVALLPENLRSAVKIQGLVLG